MNVVMKVSIKFYRFNFGVGNRPVNKMMSFLGLEIMTFALIAY